MDARLAWLLALLAGALILLVVGARQVMHRADTPLAAPRSVAMLAAAPDAGAPEVAAPLPLPPPVPEPLPDAGEDDAGEPPPAPTQDGGVGAESPADALAREVSERQRLEERLAELEATVDALTETQDDLTTELDEALDRLAVLEGEADAAAEQAVAEAPRFDRSAVLEAALADLDGVTRALAQGEGGVAADLGAIRQVLARTADEAARLGRRLEVQRLEEADTRLARAAEAVGRSDLYDARIAVLQAARRTAQARDLARTAVAQ